MLALVATDDLDAFKVSETKRVLQKKAEILRDPAVADKLETIQKRDEYLRINQEILSKGLLENPGFSRHDPYYASFPQDAVNFSPR